MNVNYTKLADLATSIATGLGELEKANTMAKQAGENAVAAGGGKATEVGNAIQNSIVSFPDEQFKAAIKVINDLAVVLSNVATTYKNANNDLVSQIAAIKAKVASQNGGNPSGNVMGNSSISSNVTMTALQ